MTVKDLIKKKSYAQIDWFVQIYDGNCLNSQKIYLGETSSKNGELIYPKEYNYAKCSLRKDCEIESYRQISANRLEITIRGWREDSIISAVPYGGVFMPMIKSTDNYGTCEPRKLVAHCSECASDPRFWRKIEKEKTKILKYLKSGQVLGSGRSKVYDYTINEMTGLTMKYYTDGEYEWDSGVIYHFEKYDLNLDRGFVIKAGS